MEQTPPLPSVPCVGTSQIDALVCTAILEPPMQGMMPETADMTNFATILASVQGFGCSNS